MSSVEGRIQRAAGSTFEVGLQLGSSMGTRLEDLIQAYIQNGPAKYGTLDHRRMQQGALPWLERLPARFQEEMRGLAEGAGIPLQRVAEWSYVEQCMRPGCSSFLLHQDGQLWVARNNDIWAPDLWGHVIIREINNRIPTIHFGMPAETFTATGINRAGLWLHYHWLPLPDQTPTPEDGLPCFIWLTDALETCSNLSQVEARLVEQPRQESMMLFAAHGPSSRGVIYECTPQAHISRGMDHAWLAGTNHFTNKFHDPPLPQPAERSLARYIRMQTLLAKIKSEGNPRPSIQAILADAEVEQRADGYGTVYSNVACLTKNNLWFTFGGYPAASRGHWAQLEWPWEE